MALTKGMEIAMIDHSSEILRILTNLQLGNGDIQRALEELIKEVYEDGYDQAAQDITMKIQSCIPAEARTVEQARIKGAWQDAAKIALNHLGKLSRKE